MGAGFIGSKKDLEEMARKEGHPQPSSVKTFSDLLNWVYEKVESKTQTTPEAEQR